MILSKVFGNKENVFIADIDLFNFRFFSQNRSPGLQIRRLDICDQPPLKARAQPVLKGGNFPGLSVTGDNNCLLFS